MCRIEGLIDQLAGTTGTRKEAQESKAKPPRETLAGFVKVPFRESFLLESETKSWARVSCVWLILYIAE